VKDDSKNLKSLVTIDLEDSSDSGSGERSLSDNDEMKGNNSAVPSVRGQAVVRRTNNKKR
jgi:hypothetical protein